MYHVGAIYRRYNYHFITVNDPDLRCEWNRRSTINTLIFSYAYHFIYYCSSFATSMFVISPSSLIFQLRFPLLTEYGNIRQLERNPNNAVDIVPKRKSLVQYSLCLAC